MSPDPSSPKRRGGTARLPYSMLYGNVKNNMLLTNTLLVSMTITVIIRECSSWSLCRIDQGFLGFCNFQEVQNIIKTYSKLVSRPEMNFAPQTAL